MITQQKEYSAEFDKEIRKYNSPMAKNPPLKVNTVTISSKNKSCQVTNLDFQANFLTIFMNVNHFTENYIFGGGNCRLLAIFFLRYVYK